MEKDYLEKIKDINITYLTWFSNKVEPAFNYNIPWEQTEDINYKLNNVGLRCDDFNKIENSNNHIIFAGCENTLPMNIKYENGWAYKIHNKFFKEKCNFINLSYPGSDSNRIIFNILKYINLYGKPSKIFILMPDIIRGYGWWEEAKAFKPKMYYQHTGGEEHNYMAIPHDLPIQLLTLKYIQSIMFIEQYCKDANIELIWTTWSSQTNKFLEKYKFDGFFNIELNNELSQETIYNGFKKKIEGLI